jgi:putative selenate reductase molybdopterin-binding subunit
MVAEVDVDEETGIVDVRRILSFIDAGRIINPLGARKQSEGGIVMGLGYALMEEFKLEEGKPVTDSLATFLIPTIEDIPPEIVTEFVGESIEFGYLGARGLAEIVMVPVAPAISNAIYNAVGARVKRIPATPEHVLKAFEEARATEEKNSE